MFKIVLALICVIRFTDVMPYDGWSNSPLVDKDRFVYQKEATNVVNIDSSKFKCFFITKNGDRLPAYINGVYENEEKYIKYTGDTKGVTKKGNYDGRHISIFIYVEFLSDNELKYFIIKGPDNYLVKVNLSEFFDYQHIFKKGNKFGLTWTI